MYTEALKTARESKVPVLSRKTGVYTIPTRKTVQRKRGTETLHPLSTLSLAEETCHFCIDVRQCVEILK